MTTMNPATREKLMGVSVATLCSALYKRGLRNQTIQDVRPVKPKGATWWGPLSRCATCRRAKTATP